MARRIGNRYWLSALAVAGLAACDSGLMDPGGVEPPVNLEGDYYNRGVDLLWEMHGEWDGEPFRVYGKEDTSPEYFFIAEVTSCASGQCVYRDINVSSEVQYEYYVAAVDTETGTEAASAHSVEVFVPTPQPPPAPTSLDAVALDGAVYLHWPDDGAAAEDFAVYRVYVVSREVYLVGESDSPAFLDAFVNNGTTYEYFVTSVDDLGHESPASHLVSATPRPDYTGELAYAYSDVPGSSGFRFQETDRTKAVIDGDSRNRHFRIYVDDHELWFGLGEGVRVHAQTRATSALTCGPGADPDCVAWDRAPTTGYLEDDLAIRAGYTYMFHVPGDDGKMRYGAVRVTHFSSCPGDDRYVIFDWAYQTQPGNPNLSILPDPVSDDIGGETQR